MMNETTLQEEETSRSETLLNEEQTAEMLGMRPSTLQRWRSKGWTELPYIKIRYLIRYRMGDIQDFLERGRIGPKVVQG